MLKLLPALTHHKPMAGGSKMFDALRKATADASWGEGVGVPLLDHAGAIKPVFF
jgi:hypothetical protein